jgi:cation:H+ antiporter
MLVALIFLVIGFALLIKGADLLVDGASSIAKRFGISDLAIGLTVVAFGTSAPELVVTLQSALTGTPDIAIGNVLGSNIANILLILGVAALITPLVVQRTTTWKEIPFALLGVIILEVTANDIWLNSATESWLTRGDGLVLLGFFAIFLYYIFGIAKKGDVDEQHIEKRSTGYSLMFIGLGLAGLVLGGKWVVESAIVLAEAWGLSQSVIGLTVVAVGTSLPELATSVVAALKGKADIAIGNIVGSNIFNIFWILGVTALVAPLPFSSDSNVDVAVTTAVTTLLFAWMFIGRKHVVERWQGGAFVVLYITYVVYLLMR